MHGRPRLLVLPRLLQPRIRLPQITDPVPRPRRSPRRRQRVPCLREQEVRICGEGEVEGDAGEGERDGEGGREEDLWEG